MSTVDLERIRSIVEVEFADFVRGCRVNGPNDMRVYILDGSYLDVWFSLKLKERYSYHWERRSVDGTVDRHDNIPHKKWESVSTFSKHFHDGEEQHVTASSISDDPKIAVHEFLAFVRKRLKETPSDNS